MAAPPKTQTDQGTPVEFFKSRTRSAGLALECARRSCNQEICVECSILWHPGGSRGDFTVVILPISGWFWRRYLLLSSLVRW